MRAQLRKVLVANVIVAAALLAAWMVADIVDVVGGQRYVSTKGRAAVHVAIIAVAFAASTWFSLATARLSTRILMSLAAMIILTLVFVVVGQFLMIYFHVMIGGYL